MDKDEMVKCFAEMLESSDIGRYVRGQMKAAEEGADEPADEPEKDAEPEDKEPADEPADDDKEKLKNERDAERRKYARLESEHKLLASRLADLERKERVSTRKADLMQIEAEGVLFDMNEELASVSDLDDKSYEKHLDKMRRRYSRSPIGVKITPAPVPDHGLGPRADLTPEQVRHAAELVLSGKAKNAEDALSMVRS